MKTFIMHISEMILNLLLENNIEGINDFLFFQ